MDQPPPVPRPARALLVATVQRHIDKIVDEAREDTLPRLVGVLSLFERSMGRNRYPRTPTT